MAVQRSFPSRSVCPSPRASDWGWDRDPWATKSKDWGQQILISLFGPFPEPQFPRLRSGSNNNSLGWLGDLRTRRGVMPVARASLDQSKAVACVGWPFRVPGYIPNAPDPVRIRRMRTTIPGVPCSGWVTPGVVVPERPRLASRVPLCSAQDCASG